MLRRLIWCAAPLVALLVFVSAFTAAPAARRQNFDWPQWQGQDRTAVSHEKGLLGDWSKEGPPLLWKADNLGGAFCTPSVARGRVFGMGFRGKDEVVWALDEKTGQELWSVKIADANKGVGYNEGPRCTPTVDGDRLYVLGLGADLVCMKTENGDEVWRKNLRKDFNGSVGGWGYSESPLIDGNKLLCTPGGKKSTLIALDKQTGELIWTGVVPQGDQAHYSSIIAANVDGQRQYIQFLRGGVVGLSGDGKFLWRYDHPHNGTANCSTPLYRDGHVFAASSYGTGGGLAKLTRYGDEVKAEEVYFTKNMKNHHGGMVLLGDYLYGSDEGKLTCLEFKTGKVQWAESKAGKGSIAYADDRLYYRNEGGPVILVEANPKKYVEHGRFSPPRTDKPAWPHPVIANGKLYIRDQQYLYCYDVKQK
ncbi:MAG TPA: PQQ-binding-like beta-propeller repeat protein [Gemmataceae bacterium]|jgi:outer membrane protein assembly factor BamB